jgi:hypothetical protein
LSSPDIPITTSAPITYTSPSPLATEPAITFDGLGPNQPAIQITNGSNPGITFYPGAIDLGGAVLYNQGIPPPDLGTGQYGGINLPPFPMLPNTVQGPAGGQEQQQPSASAFPGVVLSGSGNNYSMKVYPNGLGGPSQTATVTQLQIDPSEAIPAGTWALVSFAGGNYSMQVTTWL